ncbi:MAG: HlyC/CorC family transporter [Planctomycetes bacterium]|nr:HlyC/CorC family transporter [Planctomycetota bacterium]
MIGSEAIPWIVLPALGAASAFLSASETALFTLDERGKTAAGAGVKRLLDEPQALLVTLLLANLIVNVLFFAFAADLAPEGGPYGEVVAGLIAVAVLVLVGEMLPKSLALRAGPSFARLAAIPLTPVVALVRPLRTFVQWNLEIVMRALGDAARPEAGISAEALYAVLEHSAKGGLIETSEADLLSEVVELEGIRVREITTPRVDMLSIDLDDPDEEHRWFTIARALAKRITWLPVVRGSADTVIGQVRMRDVLSHSDARVEELVKPVLFIPEVASVFDLLNHLRANKGTEAIVVDEYGGTTGFATIEHVFEEIVGDLRVEGERAEIPVLKLEDGTFRVSGGLSIRDWNELFGREVVPAGFETVGGLVAALLGRIPKAGDVVRLAGLKLTAHEVRGRRVTSVDMAVQLGEAVEA